MEGAARHVFETLPTFLPTILPILTLYIVEAPSSLRLWLAVQKLPLLEADSAVLDTSSLPTWARFKRDLWRTLREPTFALLLLTVIVCGHALNKNESDWTSIFYCCTLIPLGSFMVARVLNTVTGLVDRVVYFSLLRGE